MRWQPYSLVPKHAAPVRRDLILRRMVVLSLALSAIGQSTFAHPVPDIPVRSTFGNDGSVTIRVEVDPRCFTPDPLNEPYLENARLLSLDREKKSELFSKARALIQDSIEFQAPPIGQLQPKFTLKFTTFDNIPLVWNSARLADTTDPAAQTPVVLTAEWKPDASQWSGYQVKATPKGKFSVRFINFVNGKEQPLNVLFPGEESYQLDLFSPVSAAEPPWVEPMKAVRARFNGQAGTLAHFGDSITVSMAYWAPLAGTPKNMDDATARAYATVTKYLKPEGWRQWKGAQFGNEGRMTIRWAHAHVDSWLKTLNPEAAVIMFGSNDVGEFEVGEYQSKLHDVVRACLRNGTVPMLTTAPPRHGFEEKSLHFADAVRKIAREERLPLIDFAAAILKRRPHDWDGALPQFKNTPGDEYQVPTLIARDGVHPSNPSTWANDFSAEALQTQRLHPAQSSDPHGLLGGHQTRVRSTLGPAGHRQPPQIANHPETDAGARVKRSSRQGVPLFECRDSLRGGTHMGGALLPLAVNGNESVRWR